MIPDYNLQFAKAAQTFTGAAASTDVLDMGAAVDLGAGEKLCILVQVKGALGNVDNTLAITLEGANVEDFGTKIIIESIPAFTVAAASPVAGRNYHFPIRSHVPQRYFRLYNTAAGTTPSVIVPFMGIVKEAQIKAHSRF